MGSAGGAHRLHAGVTSPRPDPDPDPDPDPSRAALMQGEPWDHLMPGLTVKDYVRHGGRAPLMPLSAVARSDLAGLAFRDG